MGRVHKVYLPKWLSRFSLAILVLLWLWVSYRVHFSPEAGTDLGTGGWLIMTAVMAALAVLLVLVGNRTLPIYVLEIDEVDDDEREA